MAIAFVTAGTAAGGNTSITLPYPASLVEGNILVAVVCNKYPTNAPTTPSGWVLQGRATGGDGTPGIDTGDVYASIFTKVSTGAESGNETITITSGNASVARIFQFGKDTTTHWAFGVAVGSDNSSGLDWSVTGDVNPGITTSDFIIVGSAGNHDAAVSSLETLTAADATISGPTLRNDNANSTGDDIRMTVHTFACTAGTATAAPVYAATKTQLCAGASVFLRMREVSLDGASAVTLGALTAVGTGAVDVTGAAAVTLAAVTAVGTGTVAEAAGHDLGLIGRGLLGRDILLHGIVKGCCGTGLV